MGESGWGGESAAPGAGAARRQGRGQRAAPERCHRAPQPCGRRRRAREREGESEPRRPAARSSNHRSPHPTPPNLAGPTPSAAEESGAGSYNNSARPPDPLPGSRRGRRRGAPATRGAQDRAGRGGPAAAGEKVGPQAPMGHRGGGEEGEERLRAGRIQARRRRGEERCGDRDARQPRKYSAGKQRAGAGEGRGRRDGTRAEKAEGAGCGEAGDRERRGRGRGRKEGRQEIGETGGDRRGGAGGRRGRGPR